MHLILLIERKSCEFLDLYEYLYYTISDAFLYGNEIGFIHFQIPYEYLPEHLSHTKTPYAIEIHSGLTVPQSAHVLFSGFVLTLAINFFEVSESNLDIFENSFIIILLAS